LRSVHGGRSAAAAFFAVPKGIEAVIWYAAIPRLLVFLFSAASC
jgi:hypothetical protein